MAERGRSRGRKTDKSKERGEAGDERPAELTCEVMSFGDLCQILLQIKEKVDKQEEKSDKQFEEMKEEMKQIQTINEKFDKQNEKFDKQREENQQLCREVREQNEQFNREIVDKITSHIEIIDIKMCTLKDELANQLNEFRKELVKENDERLSNFRLEIDEHIQQEVRVNCENISAKVNELDVEMEQLSFNTKQNTDKIENIEQQQLKSALEKIDSLEKIINQINSVGQTIIVRETGADIYKNVPEFRLYKHNPIEFLNRFNDYITQTGENKWEKIKYLLDNSFHGMYDGWWNAKRTDLQNYEQFVSSFTNKYWSEAKQHQVRNDLEHGKYDINRGMSPTTYFWNKVSIAKHLVPAIPEEVLCTKIAYHFEENIRRARLCAQIRDLQTMENLLADYEHENHYRRKRGFQEKTEDGKMKKVNFVRKDSVSVSESDQSKYVKKFKSFKNNGNYKKPYQKKESQRFKSDIVTSDKNNGKESSLSIEDVSNLVSSELE